MPGGVPAERRREVVGQHLVGILRVDGVGELPGVLEVRRLGLHPQHVGEGRHSQRFGDGIIDPGLDVIEAFRSLGQLAIPDDLDAHRLGPLAHLVERSAFGERQPFLDGHIETLALGRAELQHLGDRLPIGLHPRFRLPDFHIARVDLVECGVEFGCRQPARGGGALGDHGHEPDPLQPGEGRTVLGLGHGKKEVSADSRLPVRIAFAGWLR